MSISRVGRQQVFRALSIQHGVVAQSTRQGSSAAVASCQHAPGTCVLCSSPAVSVGTNVHHRFFSSKDSDKKPQDTEKTPKPSGKKATTTGGGEGGILGERSGTSKQATQSEKEIQEETVEEQHVQKKKEPETAPWAS